MKVKCVLKLSIWTYTFTEVVCGTQFTYIMFKS